MLIHFIVVCFVVLIPFIGNNYFLLMHTIIVPFIMVHWALNDNTCVLSLLETKLRSHIYGNEINEDDCFTCRLINPIYDFKANNDDHSTIIYIITILLWIISTYKLYNKYSTGEISSIRDLIIVN